jgi:uncharacterized membrane protein
MTHFLSFQIHGGASGGGLIALIAELLEFIESLFNKSPPEAFAALLPGIASMDNIHPLLVYFPIAFLAGFFLLDMAGSIKVKPQWRYAATCLLYLGTFAAALAVMAGFSAADSVAHDGEVHEIMERHEHIGVSVLGIAVFLSVWRVQRWGGKSIVANRFFLGIAAFLCLLLSFGADLGGLMVYGHGVGVTATNDPVSVLPVAPSSHAGESNHSGHSHGEHSHQGHDHSAHNHKHGHED